MQEHASVHDWLHMSMAAGNAYGHGERRAKELLAACRAMQVPRHGLMGCDMNHHITDMHRAAGAT